jgi:hypothetical protein
MPATATEREALPSALDAETQVIGSLLIDSSLAPRVLKTLRASMFVDPLHRAAFAAIAEMSRTGEPIDVATLFPKLKGRLEFVGHSPAAYLAEVGQSCVTAAHVAYHAARVADADLKRRVHIAASGIAADALNGHAGDDLLADWGATFEDFRRDQTGGERFKPISAKELANGDYRVNWIIDWFLVEGQPCILAGGKKCLKTTLLVDLLISIAIGGYFLEKFAVRSAKRVVLFSAESGEGTLQETCIRIAARKGWNFEDVPNFTLITDVPRLDNAADMAAFEAVIQDADVVALDPAYLMMPGGDAGNLFIQGEMLLTLSRLCQRLGVTLIICHHTRKHRSADLGSFDPPELEDIAWAGFQEFARQWILVGRRERYSADTGDHRLWLNFGGSAGHGGLWAVDASEGSIGDVGGRHWDVTLSKAADVRDAAEQRRAERKAEQAEEQLTSDRTAVCGVLVRFAEGLTATRIRDEAVLGKRYLSVLSTMVEMGDVELCDVFVSNQKTPKPGYRLKGIDNA